MKLLLIDDEEIESRMKGYDYELYDKTGSNKDDCESGNESASEAESIASPHFTGTQTRALMVIANLRYRRRSHCNGCLLSRAMYDHSIQ